MFLFDLIPRSGQQDRSVQGRSPIPESPKNNQARKIISNGYGRVGNVHGETLDHLNDLLIVLSDLLEGRSRLLLKYGNMEVGSRASEFAVGDQCRIECLGCDTLRSDSSGGCQALEKARLNKRMPGERVRLCQRTSSSILTGRGICDKGMPQRPLGRPKV